MAHNTRAGRGGRGNAEMPPPPDPNMAQMLRLIMEDRQAAREAQQANTVTMPGRNSVHHSLCLIP